MKIAKATAKKILIILLIVFGGLTLVGGGVFTIAMAAAGWDFTVMNNVDYVYHEYTEKEEITKVELDFDTNDIKVFFDESATQVRVEYAEKYTKSGKQLTQTTVTEENGVLKIKQVRKRVFLEFSIGESSCVNVYLPKDRAYALDIQTDTGDIWFSGYATLTDLKVKTDTGTLDLGGTIVCDGKIDLSTETGDIFLNAFVADSLLIDADTGDVTLDGICSAFGNVEIETDTGDVCILHTLSAPTIKIETDTGDVYLGNMSGTSIDVSTDTGDVKSIGTSVLDFTTLLFSTKTGDVTLHLVGTIVDYSVQAYTKTGENNLYDYPNPDKARQLKINCTTGDIKGIFLPKLTEK